MYSNMLVQAPPVSCSSLQISVIPSRPCWDCLAGYPDIYTRHCLLLRTKKPLEISVFLTSSWSICLVLGRATALPSERGQCTHRHPPNAATDCTSSVLQLIAAAIRDILFCSVVNLLLSHLAAHFIKHVPTHTTDTEVLSSQLTEDYIYYWLTGWCVHLVLTSELHHRRF